MCPITGALLLVIFTFPFPDICSAKEHVINVNAINGSDTESCLEGITPCATINMALNGSRFIGNTTLTLLISPGNYILEYGDFNNITGSGSVAIIGSGALETIVECDPGAGLYMSFLNEVTIQSITFNGCGFGNELAISFKCIYNIFHKKIVNALSAALAFKSCEIVSVHNVTILNSSGSGIILIDSRQASIVGCFISLGYYLVNGSLAVGGIVHLSSDTSGRYTLSITQSNITDNCYSAVNEEFISICTNIQATGAIVAVGAEYLDMDIDSCLIDNNSRGLYFFHSSCDHCSYNISNTIISDNQNASTLTVYDINSYSEINLTILDTELIESASFMINIPLQESGESLSSWFIDDIRFSTKRGSSYVLHLSNRNDFISYNIEISNRSIFDVYFNELEKCGTELQQSFYGYKSYFVCFVRESDCYIKNCSCYDNYNCSGMCIKGYSVAINSPYLECVLCNGTRDVVIGWVILIVLEFVPLTVMIALIAILNINLNQGSLKAYVLFCQLFTIPFPSSGYPFWVGLHNYTYRIRDFALLPFTIWNLGFISFPSCNLNNTEGEMINQCSNLSICISQNTTPLGAISFWYVIAFYPFLLLAILYGYVIMYNKGYKCVVYTGRPVHRLLARFWQIFDIQPSLSHTIASVYVLCFTQLAATSLKLLDWGFDEYFYDFKPPWHFLYDDGSQRYFEKTYGAAFFAAWFVLIVFVFLPVSYLCIYPFKWFQKCFNKLKFKKDLLISVTDVFIGPYKNGTQDTLDYRYFAGIVFAIQLVQMICSLFPFFFPTYFVQSWHIFISGLYVIFIILFRPYRRLVHSLTEVFTQLVLIGFSSFPILYEATKKKTCIGKDTVYGLWVSCTSFLYFFLMVASIYCFVWIIRKVKFAVNRWISYRAQQPLIDHDAIIEEEDDEHLEFADRLMNPKSYDERHVVD